MSNDMSTSNSIREMPPEILRQSAQSNGQLNIKIMQSCSPSCIQNFNPAQETSI